MLSTYKISKEFADEKINIEVPDFGQVPLDADLLTDEMAAASVAAGAKFFEKADGGKEPKALSKAETK